jgi:hypothetical protein
MYCLGLGLKKSEFRTSNYSQAVQRRRAVPRKDGFRMSSIQTLGGENRKQKTGVRTRVGNEICSVCLEV